MKLKKLLGVLGVCGALAGSANAVTFEVITSNITADTRWENDKVYILASLVFVEAGTLTIEPGTIIRGIDNIQAGPDGTTPAARPGGLIISQTAKIVANGTPDRPIIFTSIDDPNVPGGTSTIPGSFSNGTRTLTLGTDYGEDTATGVLGAVMNYSDAGTVTPGAPYSINSRWSGLIIAGEAFVGQNTVIGDTIVNPTTQVGTVSTNVADSNADGIPDAAAPAVPAVGGGAFAPIKATPGLTDPPKEFSLGGDFLEGLEPSVVGDDEYNFGFYGGVNDDDDSGCVRWVSIRYSGFVLESAKELQGITPGAIGTGTELEWIETILSSDDGAEFFGGKNDTRFIFAHYCDDDSFDGDEGYRGQNQFWSVVQADGGSLSGTGTPDEVIEFDGAEFQKAVNKTTLVIPQSDFVIYNMTALTNENGGGNQIDADDGADLTIRGLAFDGRTMTKGVFDFDPHVDGIQGGLLTYEDVYETTGSIGDVSPSAGGSTSTNVAAGSLVESNVPYTSGGIDQRIKPASPAFTDAVATTPAGLVYAPYAGCQRQNTLTRGWTLLDAGGDNAATGVSRVVVTGTANSSVATRPAIAFDAPAGSTSATVYHIFRSTNGCTWVPAGTIADNSAAAAGALGADADSTVGKLQFNDDAAPALAAGVSVSYYVVAN